MFQRVGLVIMLLVFNGCASMSDVIRDKDSGTAKVYAVSSEVAWKIAVQVFRSSGAGAIEEHKDEHYMLTSAERRPFSGAAFMGAWIEPLGRNRTRVTVVTKRKVSYKLTIALTESGFHSEFEERLAAMSSARPQSVSLR